MTTALTLDNAKIMEAVVEKVVDEFVRTEGDLYSEVEKRINKKIDALFLKSVEPRIQQEIDKALTDCFHREYQKRSAWGEAEGQPTTISKELEKLMGDFWSEKVNASTGTPASYNGITRAEYAMAKVLGEDFNKTIKAHLVQSAAGLKDGLRNVLRAEIDTMLGNLFHVRSGQDHAEGRYK